MYQGSVGGPSGAAQLNSYRLFQGHQFAKPFARIATVALCGVAIAAFAQVGAFAQTPAPTAPVRPVPNPCPRSKAGSVVTNPQALYSSNGVLNVQFSYQQTSDSAGRALFCFMTPSGFENPTLHINPGDTLNITITNNTRRHRSKSHSMLPIAATTR